MEYIMGKIQVNFLYLECTENYRQNEVWIKLGGDKGFKMSFQICNVEHPNLSTPTHLLTHVPSAPDNLKLGKSTNLGLW